MRSNVHVHASPGAVFDSTAIPFGRSAVHFEGTAGLEIRIASPIDPVTRIISTVSPHGLAVGDVVLLKGQRDALSDDAAEDWRLGSAPAEGTSSGACYFGEFLVVGNVPGPNQFVPDSAPIFPDYRHDAAEETSATARASSTIQRLHAVENARWVGGIFPRTADNASAFAFLMDYAVRCQVLDARVDKAGNRGGGARVFRSLRCSLDGLSVVFTPALGTGGNVTQYTAVKVVSSQAISITRPDFYGGGEQIDFTYSRDQIPTIDGSLRGGTLMSPEYRHVVAHPGAFRISVDGVMCLYSRGSGISLRSRRSRVSGCTITGPGTDIQAVGAQFGLRNSSGYAVDNIFVNNIVENFPYGYLEAYFGEGDFHRVGLMLVNNLFSNVGYGVYIQNRPGYKSSVARGSLISGNVFKSVARRFLWAGPYTLGLVVKDNSFFGPTASNSESEVFFSNNCPLNCIEGNSFYELSEKGTYNIVISSIGDTELFPADSHYYKSTVFRLNRYVGAHVPVVGVHVTVRHPGLYEDAGMQHGASAVRGRATPPALQEGHALTWYDETTKALNVTFPSGRTRRLADDSADMADRMEGS